MASAERVHREVFPVDQCGRIKDGGNHSGSADLRGKSSWSPPAAVTGRNKAASGHCPAQFWALAEPGLAIGTSSSAATAIANGVPPRNRVRVRRMNVLAECSGGFGLAPADTEASPFFANSRATDQLALCPRRLRPRRWLASNAIQIRSRGFAVRTHASLGQSESESQPGVS